MLRACFILQLSDLMRAYQESIVSGTVALCCCAHTTQTEVLGSVGDPTPCAGCVTWNMEVRSIVHRPGGSESLRG